jgi:3-oxoacyl-[acyl-carrier-protein] synthase-1/3-oxoacyl-[acyl-carrier-protein] synthase II
LKQRRVFITGMGIISSLGQGVGRHVDSLKKNCSGIKPLELFTPSPGNVFPAGEIPDFKQTLNVPRTHELAFLAAQEALSTTRVVPDSIILGTTTGGMSWTEELLKKNEKDADQYKYHATSSVAEFLASVLRCSGLVLTITTACSSGAVALKLAYELLSCGKANCVLAGGADALCRLTYYGFHSLQLIDPSGARPLDRDRNGMTVAEGSAILILEAGESNPDNAIAELLGGGLSCDAYHPAAPDPEGKGALAAMRKALQDAGISPSDVEYINLHGTGTRDNDLAEAKAIHSLFGKDIPLLSSVKGATGHSLGASGAIESVICAAAIRKGLIPANTGCINPDPALNLKPVLAPREQKVETVLSNSFGFGGNNACLVLSDPCAKYERRKHAGSFEFEVLGYACITGAGDMEQTLKSLNERKSCSGTLPLANLTNKLPTREVRRLKRLPRLALALAMEAFESSGLSQTPSSIFFSTSWGPLSETYNFLTKLYESTEQFTSPAEFIGSVHNAPAGQVAMMLKATGANITTTGGDYSFEQSLLAASLIVCESDDIVLVMGADEHHPLLSPLLDQSVRISSNPSDGGGALMIRKTEKKAGLRITLIFFENSRNNPSVVQSLVHRLGQSHEVRSKYGAIFVGMPAGERANCEKQISEIISAANLHCPIIDFRKFTGEFGSATASAAALAVRLVRNGKIPGILSGGVERSLNGKGILLLGLGSFLTAIEVLT